MNIQNNTLRICAALIMIALVMWGYWWLTWACAIILLFVFPTYYEIIAWGVLYDALYGLPIAQFADFRYVFSLASVLLFIVSFYVRKLLLTYEDTF